MQKISKETIIRTIVLAITLINQILTVIGKNPLPYSESDVYAFLSTVFSVGASLWAWWKNNSFTAAAIRADAYLTALKGGSETDD